MSIVIVTADPLYRMDGPHARLLRDAGLTVLPAPRMPLSNEDAVIAALREATAVIAGSEIYSETVIGSLPKLRIIARSGVGYDRIDLEAAARHGVAVAITPEGNYKAVAEHTLAMILALARSIVANHTQCRSGQWQRMMLVPLRGRTLGLVGLGRVGRAVAVRAAAFEMRLLAYDPVADAEFARQHGVELTGFDDVLARSDFLSLHLPATPETQGLIDRSALAKMKHGARLINTSRGSLIVEADLVEALQSGRLAGAGLDVFGNEPPRPENPLLRVENVVLSPHVASNDDQAVEDMGLAAAQNIIDWFGGRVSLVALVRQGGS